MTGKTMEVPRDLAVDICSGLRITQERAVAELRGLLAKTACIDCKETGFCLSIMGDEIRCPCHAPIKFAKPDELQAEPAAQPQGDRLGAAAEFVQKLIDSAGSQPSIATGYLSDILDVLVGNEVDGNSQAPKPQGEPSHWADPAGNTITAELKAYNLNLGGAPAAASGAYTKPLYAGQPAPVAGVPELTSELRWILGQMCFQHIHTAQALRTMGHQIARKAEDEQAVTIYWMLGHYLKDPLNWRQNAIDEMKVAAPAA